MSDKFQIRAFDMRDCEQKIWKDAIENAVEAQMKRIEYGIRGAIIAGYDGVDIHDPIFGVGGYRPDEDMRKTIEPWNKPAPDAANGMVTTRYRWDWFDNERLAEIVRTGDIPEEMIDERDC